MPPEACPIGIKEIIRPADQALVWKARKAGVPLLFRNKSASQPIPVIEDVAVDPKQMAEYIEGLDAIKPGQPVTMTVKHEDGSTDQIQLDHILNEGEIKWFYAGSALNYVGGQK